MRMCMRHWEMLRTAINARGMGHLVSENAEEAARRLEHSQSDPFQFDPLMSAHNNILAVSLRYLDAADLFSPAADGTEVCPVCAVSQKCPCDEENCCDLWIDLAADEAKDYYQMILAQQN